jgi:hypothetical protein
MIGDNTGAVLGLVLEHGIGLGQGPFAVCVTGDRDWQHSNPVHTSVVQEALDDVATYVAMPHEVTLIHGAARGVDSIAAKVAEQLGFRVVPFPAEWDKYGRAAGPIRNERMVTWPPDLVLAFHDNLAASKGTRDMVQQAIRARVPVIRVHSNGRAYIVTDIRRMDVASA